MKQRPVFCLLSAWQLFARPLDILRRAATILRRATDIRLSAAPCCGAESRLWPPETGFLWVVQRSVATGGVKYSEEEKIYCQENIWMRMTINVSGAMLCHNLDDIKW